MDNPQEEISLVEKILIEDLHSITPFLIGAVFMIIGARFAYKFYEAVENPDVAERFFSDRYARGNLSPEARFLRHKLKMLCAAAALFAVAAFFYFKGMSAL